MHKNEGLLGGTIMTDEDQESTFVYDEHEEHVPYYQVDINTHHIVDAFPTKLFNTIGLGFELEVGGKITALFAK